MTQAWPPRGLASLAEALPWEHVHRGIGWDVAAARWRMESGTAGAARDLPSLGLLLGPGGTCDDWLRTVATWHLQTAQTAGWWVVGLEREPWQAEREAAGLPAPRACATQLDAMALRSASADWALHARAGDLLHPSLALTVGLAARDGARAACWDWLTHDLSNGRLSVQARHRGPFRDLVRELAEDVRGRAFALPAGAWHGFGGGDTWTLRMSLPDALGAAEWDLQPEPLAMYPVALPCSRRRDQEASIAIAQARWGASFGLGSNGRLRPSKSPGRVSVILMYRDRPELTVQAIESVITQAMEAELELVLVDNDSRPDSREALERTLSRVPRHVQVIRLSSPGPFNHSAQAAQAAAAAAGEVLVWLNNDARLQQRDALDQLARWACLPRVASVGVAVVDAAGAVVGGGMRARRLPGPEFNSPVEEASGTEATHAREVIGNSFACAAVSARAWRELGGLDSARFPAGYNDVDYCLRAVSRGWTHVNLGHVQVRHEVGASRARQDEVAQKTRLRMRYPWTAIQALQEPAREPVSRPAVLLPSLQATAGTGEVA